MSVEIPIAAPSLADTMSRMRAWLDHRRCEPIRFESHADEAGAVLIRVEFRDDADAAAFRAAFIGGKGNPELAAAA